jgi:hypothetical protein
MESNGPALQHATSEPFDRRRTCHGPRYHSDTPFPVRDAGRHAPRNGAQTMTASVEARQMTARRQAGHGSRPPSPDCSTLDSKVACCRPNPMTIAGATRSISWNGLRQYCAQLPAEPAGCRGRLRSRASAIRETSRPSVALRAPVGIRDGRPTREAIRARMVRRVVQSRSSWNRHGAARSPRGRWPPLQRRDLWSRRGLQMGVTDSSNSFVDSSPA